MSLTSFFSLTTIFILGLIVGSFLNVVIFRLRTGKTLGGRSQCMSCGKTLSWWELFPVLSFLLSLGKCRSCNSKLSIQYPIIEISTGFVFLLFFLQNIQFLEFWDLSVLILLIELIIWSTLLVVLVYDLRHMIIPDTLSLIFGVFSIAFVVLSGIHTFTLLYVLKSSLLGMITIAGFLYFLWLVSKGRWIGLGDAKLAIGMGIYLGIAKGLSALAFAFWIGAIVSIALIILSRSSSGRLRGNEKSLTMKTEIPLAPFLIIGMFVAELLGSDIFHISSIL